MDEFMKAAYKEAQQGLQEGGIPIGSVLVHGCEIISQGRNQRIQKESSILHAEMDALENAGRKNVDFYKECIIYTTLSPCVMCSGAILLYGIPEVVIGENKSFMGAEDFLRSQGVKVKVIQSPRCIEMMSNFIEKNYELWNEDIGL
ncbi:nucleoside deaminase [Methanobacterium alcaliphilum]|nr:nucleoside deaminase [Methanobacterium alcaliphilum]MCK9151402.1 nucleoside deaminase [Methanobacterium alcaliphilum]